MVFVFYLIWFLVFISFQLSTSLTFKSNEAIVSTFALLFFVWLILLSPILYGVILQIKSKKILPIVHYYIPAIVLIINVFSLVFFSINTSKDETFTYEVVENVMTYVNYIVVLFLFPITTIYYSFSSYKLLLDFNNKNDWKTLLRSNLFVFVVLFNLFISLWFFNYLIDTIVFKVIIKSYFFIYFPLSVFIIYKSRVHETEDEDINEKIINNFIEVMTSEKIFLNSKLTIRKAAKLLGTNEKYLSNSINKLQNESFSTIVNNYRVEYAKELLVNSEYENYTIESIGTLSGFNSKSNFNSVFKKTTGITPSEYKNNKRA